MAFVYAARGEWKEAARWQRRALELLPEVHQAERETLTAQLEAYEARQLEFEW